MTPTVTPQSVTTAQVRMVNTADESRQYDITATATKTEYKSNVLSDGSNGNIQNGIVNLEDKQVAVFYSPNEMNLNVTYYVADKQQRADILSAIEDFVAAVRDYIGKAVVSVTIPD